MLSMSKEAATAASNCQEGGDKKAVNTTPLCHKKDFSELLLKVPFPFKLWQFLEDSEQLGLQSTASWLPSEDGFGIFRPTEFAATLMRSYFPSMSSYHSFTQEVRRRRRRRRNMNLKTYYVYQDDDSCSNSSYDPLLLVRLVRILASVMVVLLLLAGKLWIYQNNSPRDY